MDEKEMWKKYFRPAPRDPKIQEAKKARIKAINDDIRHLTLQAEAGQLKYVDRKPLDPKYLVGRTDPLGLNSLSNVPNHVEKISESNRNLLQSMNLDKTLDGNNKGPANNICKQTTSVAVKSGDPSRMKPKNRQRSCEKPKRNDKIPLNANKSCIDFKGNCKQNLQGNSSTTMKVSQTDKNEKKRLERKIDTIAPVKSFEASFPVQEQNHPRSIVPNNRPKSKPASPNGVDLDEIFSFPPCMKTGSDLFGSFTPNTRVATPTSTNSIENTDITPRSNSSESSHTLSSDKRLGSFTTESDLFGSSPRRETPANTSNLTSNDDRIQILFSTEKFDDPSSETAVYDFVALCKTDSNIKHPHNLTQPQTGSEEKLSSDSHEQNREIEEPCTTVTEKTEENKYQKSDKTPPPSNQMDNLHIYETSAEATGDEIVDISTKVQNIPDLGFVDEACISMYDSVKSRKRKTVSLENNCTTTPSKKPKVDGPATKPKVDKKNSRRVRDDKNSKKNITGSKKDWKQDGLCVKYMESSEKKWKLDAKPSSHCEKELKSDKVHTPTLEQKIPDIKYREEPVGSMYDSVKSRKRKTFSPENTSTIPHFNKPKIDEPATKSKDNKKKPKTIRVEKTAANHRGNTNNLIKDRLCVKNIDSSEKIWKTDAKPSKDNAKDIKSTKGVARKGDTKTTNMNTWKGGIATSQEFKMTFKSFRIPKKSLDTSKDISSKDTFRSPLDRPHLHRDGYNKLW